MKKITVYILLLLLLSSICSCLDDKNNYDYTPINELKGTISNIEKNYSVGIDEDLVITPTFEFTIDKTDPDVSYEWRLDGELLNVKAPSYTFNSHKIGLFELTFSVIDNKTGVKYSASTDILVRSPYQRGWVVLSDVDGKSTLSFIKIKTLYGVSETVNIWGEKVVRDSIAYHSVEKYLVTVRPMPNAPTAPTQVVKPTAPSTGKSGVKSPLPGVILDIKVNVGDTVKKGQTIIILEAMKMENNINADKDGKITAINVNKGDSVLEGNDLVIIE